MRNVWLKKFLMSAVLVVWALVTVYVLICYRPMTPSLWYVDSAMHVSIWVWLRATYAEALIRFLGFGVWWLPVVLVHAAYAHVSSAWRTEWDRGVAFVTLLVATSMFFVLTRGMLWRGQFVDGGVLGRWFVHSVLPSDVVLAYVLVGAALICAGIVAARLSFVAVARGVMMSMVWLVQHSVYLKRATVWLAHASIITIRALARGARWVVRIITGKPAAEDVSVLLAQEQFEQLPTLASIVQDAVWQPYTQTPEIPVQDASATIVSACVDQTTHVSAEQVYHIPHLRAELPEAVVYIARDELQEQARTLEHKLASFGIQGRVTDVAAGPLISCFSYQPSVDTKLSRITALEDDLSLALQATSLRVLAPIPGTDVVGFEVAHKQRQKVLLAPLFESVAFKDLAHVLPVALGVDSVGKSVVVDLTRMPHLLIAGATGSGKSVALHSIVLSLLCRFTPDELKVVLIDPKRIELRAYADIAHLACPIVTEPSVAVLTLQWLVETMEQRYAWLAQKGVRSITDYHTRFGKQGRLDMPFMVVVIDELADLMMSTRDRIEPGLVRLAQMARAAGIHLIVATQRPSVDVITGLIKVNFVSRIALRVTSAVDSRIIIDAPGAEKLLGYGDMLLLSPGMIAPLRVHGAYVADHEIEQVCSAIRAQRMVHYETVYTANQTMQSSTIDEQDDELYPEIVRFLHEIDEVSISLLQRRFKIGFNRSARMIERLELEGKITQPLGGKTRKVVRAQ